MFLHVILLAALSAVLAVGLGLSLWVMLGQPHLVASIPAPVPTSGGAPPPTAPNANPPLTAADRLDSLKLVLAIVAGIGGIVALTVAYRRQRHNEAAEKREDTRLFTERFVKASEQLGHDSPRVRIAGSYAIAELADDWVLGRQMCVDVLCAYLRLPYENPGGGEREVRRTLFRIIRNHLRPEARWGRVKWWDCRFSFEGAEIDNGDLSRIHLSGDGNMNFYGVRFTGGFHFSEVRLNGAPVWFTKASFGGDYVTFDGADFGGSKVSFDEADFAGANITFENLIFDPGSVTFNGAKHTAGEVDWGPLSTLIVDQTRAGAFMSRP